MSVASSLGAAASPQVASRQPEPDWRLFDALDDGVAVVCAQSGQLVYVNQTLRRWHEAAHIGMTLEAVFPGFDGPSLQRCLNDQVSYTFEHYFKPLEGRAFNGELTCRPLDGAQWPGHWLVQARNIARVYEQEALLKSYREMLDADRRLLVQHRKRIEEQSQKTRDLLNSVDQGVFTFNLDLTVNPEHSARAESLFQTSSFDESTLETLFGVAPSVIAELAEWIEMIAMPRNLAKWWRYRELAPIREMRREHLGEMQIVSIEFQPIIQEGRLTRMMVLGRDVTAQRLAEERLQREQRLHAEQSDRILGCINSDPNDVRQFLAECAALVAQQRVPPYAILGPGQQVECLGRFHTIKGTAGSLGFGNLARLVDSIESVLDRAIKGVQAVPPPSAAQQIQAWLDGLDAVDAELSLIEGLFAQIYGATRDHMLIERRGYERLLDAIAVKDDEQALQCVRALNQAEFDAACRKYKQIVQQYRERYGKALADLQVLTPRVRIDRDALARLDACLVHMVRNACDHGIEPDAVRRSLGKGPGHISLACFQTADQWCVEVQDDGRGIDGVAMADRAVALGLISAQAVAAMTPAQRVRLVFLPGLTTRDTVTEISGRGVGLDVVFQTLENLGAQVDIETAVGVGTLFRITLPMVRAQHALAWDGHADRGSAEHRSFE